MDTEGRRKSSCINYNHKEVIQGLSKYERKIVEPNSALLYGGKHGARLKLNRVSSGVARYTRRRFKSKRQLTAMRSVDLTNE